MKANVTVSIIILTLQFLGNISCSSESKNSEGKRVSKKSESKNSENKSDSGGNSSLDLNDILGHTWYICEQNGDDADDYVSTQWILEESSDGNYKITKNEYYYDDEDCTEGEEEIEDTVQEFEVTIEKSGNGLEMCFSEEEFEKMEEEYDEEVEQCMALELTEDGELVFGDSEPIKRRK